MLTGRGRYVSDWNLPGQAYGHFLRSDRAHAEILSIDASEALRHPGVLAVFTGNDLDLKSLPAALPAKGRGGSELINPGRSEEHTSALQSPCNLVCRRLL